MKKYKNLIVMVIIMIMVIVLGVPVYSMIRQDLVGFMKEEAMRINEKKVSNNGSLSKWDLASEKDIGKRVEGLKYYSELPSEVYSNNCYDISKLNIDSEKLFKISFCIASHESWWVNWKSLDDGLGFGYISMHWTTAEDMAKIYGWDWEKEKDLILSSSKSDKLQAKYFIGYLLYLYNYYDKDYKRMIIGYNKGLGVDRERRWESYYFIVKGRLAELNKWEGVDGLYKIVRN